MAVLRSIMTEEGLELVVFTRRITRGPALRPIIEERLDWILRNPVTKRFVRRPKRVFYICAKRADYGYCRYRRGKGQECRWVDIEAQFVCHVNTPQEFLDTIDVAMEKCENCEMRCGLKDKLRHLEDTQFDVAGFSVSASDVPPMAQIIFNEYGKERVYYLDIEHCCKCIGVGCE